MPASRRAWFGSIQGLRAVAMLLVFGHHLAGFIMIHQAGMLCSALRTVGGIGTDLFFCISGCFIYRQLCTREMTWLEFFARRLRRLYPVYASMLLLYVAIDLAMGTNRLALPSGKLAAARVLENLLFLPVWLGNAPVLSVAWALGYIVVIDALMPFAARCLQCQTRKTRVIALLVLWAAVLVYGVVPARVSLLIAGIVVWESMHFAISPTTLVAAAGLGVVARFWLPGAWSFAGTAIFIPAVLRAALGGIAWMECAFSHRRLAWLGYRSYSFYLCHGLPLLALSIYVFPHLHGWQFAAVVPLCFAASLAFTELVHRLIEVPLSLRPSSGIPIRRTSAEAGAVPVPVRS